MSIEQIKTDALANRKACMNKNLDEKAMERLQIERKLYSSVTGDFKRIEVDERREATDGDAEAIIRKYINNCRENLVNYRKVNNTEKAYEVEVEMETLAKYMPQQLTTEQLKEVIENFITSGGITRTPASIKLIMQHLNQNYKDTFNPKEASALAGAALKG